MKTTSSSKSAHGFLTMKSFDLPRNLVGMISHCHITEWSFNSQNKFELVEKSNPFSYTVFSIFDSLMNQFENVADQLIILDAFFSRIFREKLQFEQYIFDLLLGDLMVSGRNQPSSRRVFMKTKNPSSMFSLIYMKKLTSLCATFGC